MLNDELDTAAFARVEPPQLIQHSTFYIAVPPMFVEVALPLPLLQTFTYAVPDDLRDRVQPGARVLVPFGRKERIGWIDCVVAESDLERLRPLHGVLDEAPSASPPLLRLCRWIADYYVAPLGQVLRTALPNALCDSSTDFLSLSDSGDVSPDRTFTPLEARLVEWLGGRESRSRWRGCGGNAGIASGGPPFGGWKRRRCLPSTRSGRGRNRRSAPAACCG